jgi:hypothetical protein
MVYGKKKNPSKAKNHSFLQVPTLVKNGFNEALKDFVKNFFTFCFKTFFLLIVYFLIYLFK